MNLIMYPFKLLRKQFATIVIPFIPILFLIVASAYVTGQFAPADVIDSTEHYLGGNLALSASNLKEYDNLGADGLIPIIRFGGVTKAVDTQNIFDVLSGKITENLLTVIVALSLFFMYIAYAMVSRVVYDNKKGRRSFGLKGINLATIALALIAMIVILVISSFSLQGFQLVLLLNFCVFFALAMPHAASGDEFGESFYKATEFFRFNLRGIIEIYLICIGIAIGAPIGLLLIFMFPLSVLSAEILPVLGWLLSLLGITFALYYQFVVCARASLDFSRKPETRAPAFKTRMAKRVR